MKKQSRTSKFFARFRKPEFITKNILVLSFVSFFTDIASEMVYPIIPLYLSSLGFSVVAIGLLEGVANAVTGLSQGWFGYLSDRLQKPEWFVRFGYGISALSKPMLAVFPGVYGWLFGARVMDRFGKAVRSASRDAILANDSSSDNRGKVFGFHRSMDTLGATLGPIAAVLLLYALSGNYQVLFLIAAVPGIASVILTFRVQPGRFAPREKRQRPPGFKAFRNFIKTAHPSYKRILIGLLLIALVNGSDFFLLLRARELGLTEIAIVGIYILYNLVYTLIAYPAGALSDRIGFRKVFIVGLLVFAIVYGAMSTLLPVWMLIFIFALYGIFTATIDAVCKAWLSKYLTSETQATGMGLYLTLNSLAFLVATAGTGLLWQYAGSQIAFTVISLASLVAIVYFMAIPLKSSLKTQKL
jgi:MFS family permease